jgi:hypothetical protein
VGAFAPRLLLVDVAEHWGGNDALSADEGIFVKVLENTRLGLVAYEGDIGSSTSWAAMPRRRTLKCI